MNKKKSFENVFKLNIKNLNKVKLISEFSIDKID